MRRSVRPLRRPESLCTLDLNEEVGFVADRTLFLAAVLAEQTPPSLSKTGAQQDTVVEEIVARVNNSIITRADLRRNRGAIRAGQ